MKSSWRRSSDFTKTALASLSPVETLVYPGTGMTFGMIDRGPGGMAGMTMTGLAKMRMVLNMFLNLILLAKVVTDQHLKDLREMLKPPLLGQLGPHRAHRHDGGSVTGPPLAAIPENAVPDVQKTPLHELSVADSFIMEVLRGWRLLQAAGLTAEEKCNILSTTKHSSDHRVRSSEPVWDEQLLGQHRGNFGTFQTFAASVDDGEWFEPESQDPWEDGWDDWSSSYYAGQ